LNKDHNLLQPVRLLFYWFTKSERLCGRFVLCSWMLRARTTAVKRINIIRSEVGGTGIAITWLTLMWIPAQRQKYPWNSRSL